MIYTNLKANPQTISDKSKEKKETQIEMRNYQYKLFQKSKEENSIVVLETGTGKTMIAIYLIYHHLSHYNLEKKVLFIHKNSMISIKIDSFYHKYGSIMWTTILSNNKEIAISSRNPEGRSPENRFKSCEIRNSPWR